MIDLVSLVTKQINSLFGLCEEEMVIIKEIVDEAEGMALESLFAFSNKNYVGRRNPFNSVENANFIYWLGRLCNEHGGW